MHLMTRNYPLGSDIRERNTWKHGFKSVCALMSLPPPPHVPMRQIQVYYCSRYHACRNYVLSQGF